MTNLNKLRSAMLRDHEQGQQIEDEKRHQREKEREEVEWQKYLEKQSTKMKTFELTFRITVSDELYASVVSEYGEDGIEEAAKKYMSEKGVEGVGDIELIKLTVT